MSSSAALYDNLSKIEQYFFDAMALALVGFYSYAAVLEPAATQYHRGVYVIITYILVFLIYRSQNRFMRVVDYLLIALSILSIGYWIINFEAINYRSGAETELDQYISVIGVLIGIEVARRVVGNVFVVIGAILLLYGVYGYASWIPEDLQHAGDTFLGLCTSIFYKSDGVFGIMA
ncbi:MAG: TRAP transporter permease, partial [Gammaproteobacteria bacterium]